jgi:hypothetical protein
VNTIDCEDRQVLLEKDLPDTPHLKRILKKMMA